MSPRITHANPEGLELGTSEQQIVLAEDGFGAKKPTDLRPVVSTSSIKVSSSAPLLLLLLPGAGVCISRHFLLEQGEDTGMGWEQSVAYSCSLACPSPRPASSNTHLLCA